MKKMMIAFLALLMALTFTGCAAASDTPAEPVNIAFVVGIADDETKFNAGIQELAALPALPGSDYAFISIEGSPALIGQAGTIPNLTDRGYSEVMMDRVRAGIQADLASRLAEYEPKSAQIDLAGATELAVRTLKANADNRRNVLVYYCGGKSTAGLINMLDTPAYKLDPAASAAAVAQKMQADMSGIDVIWYCLGDFGPKQEKLSAFEREQLKAFYEQLFTALGAKSVTFKTDLPSREAYSFADTPVSAMAVKPVVSGLEELAELEPEVFEEPDVLHEPIVITEEQVCFVGDKAVYLNPQEAQKVLEPIAQYLAGNQTTILLCGTTAGDVDTDFTLQLSRDRAEAVKQTLVDFGVAPERILTVGLASSDPWHIYSAGYDGPDAAANRKVVLLDAASDTAQEILAREDQ